jgi:hypothetical protein
MTREYEEKFLTEAVRLASTLLSLKKEDAKKILQTLVYNVAEPSGDSAAVCVAAYAREKFGEGVAGEAIYRSMEFLHENGRGNKHEVERFLGFVRMFVEALPEGTKVERLVDAFTILGREKPLFA